MMDVAIPGDEMLEIVREKAFTRLPDYMQHVAADAYETLLHTRDGQLCDVMIDRATLDAVYAAGKASKAQIIRDYAESTVAVADIKIAVRSQKNREIYRLYEKGNGGVRQCQCGSAFQSGTFR